MNAPTACELNPASASSPRPLPSSSSTQHTRRDRYPIDACIVPALLLLLSGSALLGRDRLAFRDVSHFYTPLYHHVAQRTSQQWIPLWNSRCQTGMPLLGETTTAVLYPVRYAIGCLPLLAERQIAWYVAFHLILASLLARFAAARSGCGRSGSMAAGLTYPLSGSVFFLYCNPPFLVSAAWLPVVLSMLITPGRTSVGRRIAVSAFALSMMVLAGDPQTALHVMMLCGLVMVVRVVIKTTHPQELGILVAAAGLAAVMSAPQLAASVSWTTQSDRAYFGISQSEAMQYSVAPWHFAELFTPNLFGTLFPINQRISALIAGDGQMWTPTLFMGLLPAVMILDRLLRWRRTRHDVWLLMSALAAVLAMGHFGVSVWLYEYFPGYNTLRYPAKWLPVFAIGLSMAFAGWIDDRSFTNSGKAFGLAGMILLVAILSAYWLPLDPASLDPASIPTDEFWGPVNLVGAKHAILISLVFSFACLLFFLGTVWKYKTSRPNLIVGSIMTLLVLELTWSVSNQLRMVSIDAEQKMVKECAAEITAGAERLLRMQTTSMWPEDWREGTSENRMLEVEARQRAALFGRWHLMSDYSVFNNFVSIRSRNHAMFWRSIEKLQDDEERIDWNLIQHWLAIDQAVIQSQGRLIWRPTDPRPDVIEVLSNWTQSSPSTDPYQRIKDIAGGRVAGAQALTDLEPSKDDASNRLKARLQQNATWFMKDESPEQILVEITTDQTVLIVRPTFQDGHWIAERRSLEIDETSWVKSKVGQVDFLKQGTVVPPGRWEIRFSYQPWWWMASIGIAVVGWVVAGMLVFRESNLVGLLTGLSRQTVVC